MAMNAVKEEAPAMQPQTESPVNPLPPAVVALVLVLAGIELLFSLGQSGTVGGSMAAGWRLDALTRFAFSGDLMRWMIETQQAPAQHLIRLVAYAFVHASFTQTLFSCVMLLAMGKIVAEALGSASMVGIFFLSAVGGALAYTLTGDPAPLVGSFPAIYGLIGGFTFLLWLKLGQVGASQARAFSMIGVLMGLQLVFGVLFDGGFGWAADLGGFATGFVLTTLLVPGGLANLIARIRRD